MSYRRCGRNLQAKLDTVINLLSANHAYLKTLYPCEFQHRTQATPIKMMWRWRQTAWPFPSNSPCAWSGLFRCPPATAVHRRVPSSLCVTSADCVNTNRRTATPWPTCRLMSSATGPLWVVFTKHFLCLSVCLSVYVSNYLSIYLFIFLSFYLSIYLSFFLSIFLSFFLSFILTLFLCFYLYLSAFVNRWLIFPWTPRSPCLKAGFPRLSVRKP